MKDNLFIEMLCCKFTAALLIEMNHFTVETNIFLRSRKKLCELPLCFLFEMVCLIEKQGSVDGYANTWQVEILK